MMSTEHLVPYPHQVGLIAGINRDKAAPVLNNHHFAVSFRPDPAEKDSPAVGCTDWGARGRSDINPLVGIGGILGEAIGYGAPDRPKERLRGARRAGRPYPVSSPWSPMQPGQSIPSRNSKALAYLDMVRVLEAVVALDSLCRESVSLCNCIEGFSLEDDVDPLIRGWPLVP